MRKSDLVVLSAHAAAVRQDVFGVATPPFRSTLAAARWVEEESAQGRTAEYQIKRQAADELRHQLVRRVVAARRKLPVGVGISVGLTVDRLAYIEPAEGAVKVVEATTTRLVLLTAAVQQIAELAGCLEHRATDYLLTGAAIPERRIHGQRVVSNQVGYAVHSTSTASGASQWEAHIRAVKHPRDRALLRFAAEKHAQGHPPPAPPGVRGQDRGVRKYWEAFTSEWNARNPDWLFKHWTGLRKRYAALVDNLPAGVEINE